VIFRPSTLAGVVLVESQVAEDERGAFTRTFAREEFEAQGLDARIDHVALSSNRRRGTLRGLHYQGAPHEQARLVRCTRGVVYDVVVDIRRESATYLKWVAFELRAAEVLAVYIPPGCAHGFETLEDDSEVHYQISSPRRPESEKGLRWDDPALGISWPLHPIVISSRDRDFPLLPP
jgi:dTDP-4-dehydrorhamnose 3,5-epimerase